MAAVTTRTPPGWTLRIAADIAALVVLISAVATFAAVAGAELDPSWIGPVAGISCGVAGWVLARRQPTNPVGWQFLVVAVCLPVSSALLAQAASQLADARSGTAVAAAVWVGSWLWVPGYCTLATLLPSGSPTAPCPRRAGGRSNEPQLVSPPSPRPLGR